MDTINHPIEIFDIEERNIALVEKVFELLTEAMQNIAHIKEYSSKQDSKSIRTLKITELPYQHERFNYKPRPFIRLTGRWLDKAGFETNEYAQIITLKGIVLIVPVKVPEMDFVELV